MAAIDTNRHATAESASPVLPIPPRSAQSAAGFFFGLRALLLLFFAAGAVDTPPPPPPAGLFFFLGPRPQKNPGPPPDQAVLHGPQRARHSARARHAPPPA